MTLYEKRSYAISVVQMTEVIQLYSEEGYPVLATEGFAKHLFGCLTRDTGCLHELVHIWRFGKDEARRALCKRRYAHEAFGAFVSKLRPLIDRLEGQLPTATPLRPQP